jgi:hypothetical protein
MIEPEVMSVMGLLPRDQYLANFLVRTTASFALFATPFLRGSADAAGMLIRSFREGHSCRDPLPGVDVNAQPDH